MKKHKEKFGFCRLLIFLFMFFGTETLLFSQDRVIDSLKLLIKTDNTDTNKIYHLNRLGGLYRNKGIYDTALEYHNSAIELAKQLLEQNGNTESNLVATIKKALGSGYTGAGLVCWYSGDYTNALSYHSKALKIADETDDQLLRKKSFGNLGLAYYNLANYPKALDYGLKMLKLNEATDDKMGIAIACNNIGNVYNSLNDFDKALSYYNRSLELAQQIDHKQLLPDVLGNLGNIYNARKEYKKALDYSFKALKIDEEIGYIAGAILDYENIGSIYFELAQHTSSTSEKKTSYNNALMHFNKALKAAEEYKAIDRKASTMGNMGSLFSATGDFKKAELFLKRAIELNDSIGALNFSRQFEESLSDLYDTLGQHKKALQHYKRAMVLKDTLFNRDNKSQLVQKEMNFEFEKKEATTKALHDKEMAVATAEKKKQQIIIWSAVVVLIMLLLIAAFIFNTLRLTRKQKMIIELQKSEVSKQKEIVEKQKEKIIDSITYAKQIQQSILPDQSELNNYLPESFIYYQPKDIVSGDFYWCSKMNNKVIVAAVDCTGHGVPGAFMSMIGNILLNKIVNENKITKPTEILKRLSVEVSQALHQQKSSALSHDGMDMAVCCIDYINKELHFAGAQNPIYVVSGNEIQLLKADRKTIGSTSFRSSKNNIPVEYVGHTVPLTPDMYIYMFTDGYIDQFGGEEKKKFGISKFMELIENNHRLSMQEQKRVIESAHKNWKAEQPQTDDILVMGIKL